MPGESPRFEVVEGDALAFETDVLVLKHAQTSLGVDAKAKERLGLDQDMSLPSGAEKVVGGPPGMAAEHVVFLGVQPLLDFGYWEIGEFGRRAVEAVGVHFPAARSLAVTLHGAGYGLDEIACFEAELNGLVGAIQAGGAPNLESVVFVEADRRRAERMRSRLAGLTSAGPDGDGEIAAEATRGLGRTLVTTAAGAPARRDHAFVAMPFAEEFDDVFHYGITAAVHASGLLCERIDQAAFTGDILARMKGKIRTATLMVADLTDANPNVYLEVGFAWAAEVPTVLVHRADSELKFDVQGERCLSYRSIRDLEDRLTQELRQLTA